LVNRTTPKLTIIKWKFSIDNFIETHNFAQQSQKAFAKLRNCFPCIGLVLLAEVFVCVERIVGCFPKDVIVCFEVSNHCKFPIGSFCFNRCKAKKCYFVMKRIV
jgi:hypothetical protein